MKQTIIPLGPYHPLLEEPEHFKLYVEGERVVDLDVEIGYNHRGVEKLSEGKTWDQVRPIRRRGQARRLLSVIYSRTRPAELSWQVLTTTDMFPTAPSAGK